MKCPHCAVEFHDKTNAIYTGKDIDGTWYLLRKNCPACHKLIFHLYNKKEGNTGERVSLSNHLSIGAECILSVEGVPEEKTILIRPKNSYRPPCPPQIPKEIAEDYTEACLTLTDSPKASAALSRRCLQNILRDPNTANAQQKDLVQQIEHVLSSKTLPTHIANDIDAIRNIGNFAAHPTKSQAKGIILPVEPGEAEWNLNVIEALFDFYYVQPEISQRRRDALNAKLRDAGKPSMRQ
jgi:Domain of unknown function (DUF4145)